MDFSNNHQNYLRYVLRYKNKNIDLRIERNICLIDPNCELHTGNCEYLLDFRLDIVIRFETDFQVGDITYNFEVMTFGDDKEAKAVGRKRGLFIEN